MRDRALTQATAAFALGFSGSGVLLGAGPEAAFPLLALLVLLGPLWPRERESEQRPQPLNT